MRQLSPASDEALARLRARLHPIQQPLPQSLRPAGFREAAVLVPLVPAGDELALLLTVRPAHLRQHPGQIAFPGGKRDPEDGTLLDTALREAAEELGLSGAEVLGYLSDIPTPAGFLITPVVGLLRGRLELRPNPGEVAETFVAPLSALRQVYSAGPEREFLGHRYIMHEYPYQTWRIWGATAAMISQLLHLLDAPAAPISTLR